MSAKFRVRGSTFLSALVAVCLVAVVFAAGVLVGSVTGKTVVEVAIPDTITVNGTAHEKTECMEWVMANMEKANAGTVALMCNGRE